MTQKASTVTEEAIHKIHQLLAKFGKPPYVKVNAPIKTISELIRMLSGKSYAYLRLGMHPDQQRIEEWLSRHYNGAVFRTRADGMNAISMAVYTALENASRRLAKKGLRPQAIFVLPAYKGTYKLGKALQKIPLYNVDVTFLYAHRAGFLQKLSRSLSERTAVLIFDVECNPTLFVPNLKEIGECCRLYPNLVTVCDITFFFGILAHSENPFAFHINVLVASGTKFLARGYWTLGFIGVSKKFHKRCPHYWRQAQDWAERHGGTLGPLEASLTANVALDEAVKTAQKKSENAKKVAAWLRRDPRIRTVNYPGKGGMITFCLNTDKLETALKFLCWLQNNTLVGHRVSLGGDQTIASSPGASTHYALGARANKEIKSIVWARELKRWGVRKSDIRLSCGLELAELIIAALGRGLDAVLGPIRKIKREKEVEKDSKKPVPLPLTPFRSRAASGVPFRGTFISHRKTVGALTSD